MKLSHETNTKKPKQHNNKKKTKLVRDKTI